MDSGKIKRLGMPESELVKWHGMLWKMEGKDIAYAYCPKHVHRLDLASRSYGRLYAQEAKLTRPIEVDYRCFICPEDNEEFEVVGGSYWTMRRRFLAKLESDELKFAKYKDLDNIYTPILTVSPKPKDPRYSIQVEVDDTPEGKKLVIYAADRKNLTKKAQIFIDPQSDKISFDPNDIHPNMVFSKVIAYFKEDKKATLEINE